MMTHPGKKLLFMGQDIAEYDEWNEERGVEWELLKYDHHEQIRRFVKRLNELYRKNLRCMRKTTAGTASNGLTALIRTNARFPI